MWLPYLRRKTWLISDNGAAPIYAPDDERAMRVRALKSSSLTITEEGDCITIEASGGPGSSPLDAWPVGSVFLSTVATGPATLLGGGQWQAIGAGRVLVGFDGTDVDFDTLGKMGGEKSHTLTAAEMPAHTHVQDAHTHTQQSHNHTQNSFAPRIVNSGTAGTVGVQGASTASNANASNSATTATNQAATAVNNTAVATNQITGGDGAHNNVQPYLVVQMWKRIA